MSFSRRIVPLFVLLAAFRLTGCDNPDKSAEPNKIVQIAIWEDQGTLHNGDLLKYLTDHNVDVRRQAAIAAARIGDTMAAEALVIALGDRDTVVRARAAFALGHLRHKPVKSQVYQRVKKETNGFVVEYLLWALGRLYTPEYSDSLMFLLEHPDPRVRGQAALTMNMLSHKKAGPAVAALIDDLDLTVRHYALIAITRLDPQNHADLIVRRLKDPDVTTRRLAVYALGFTKDTKYYSQLVALLEDPDRWVRTYAAYGVGIMRDTTRLNQVYPFLHTEKDPRVLEQLVEVIGWHRRTGAVTDLLKLKNHPDIGLRVKLVAALTRSLHAEAFEAIAPLADDPAWAVRAAVPAQLDYLARARMGSPEESVELMIRMINDSVPAVRAAVVKAGMSLGSAMYEPVAQAMHDPDGLVRHLAMNVFVFAGGRLPFDTLAQWYIDEQDNPRNDVRMAILALTGNLSPSVHIGETQRKIFEMGITDKDRLVRQYAAAVWIKFREDKWDQVGVFDSPIDEKTYSEYYGEYSTPPRVRFATEKGAFVVELYADETPRSVHHFLTLVRSGFYDNTPVGLKETGRMVYLGDQRADNWGFCDETIRDEVTLRRTEPGSLVWWVDHRHDTRSMFGIALTARPLGDFNRTIFGKVVEGMETVERLRPIDKIEKAEIISPEIAMH